MFTGGAMFTTPVCNGALKLPGLPGDASGPATLDVKVVDLNSDGRADVVVGRGTETAVFLSRADGSAGAPVTYPFSGRRIQPGDFNGDGKVDLVLLAASRTLLGNGDGTFGAPVTNMLNVSAESVAGYFNDDANLDLAHGARSAATAMVVMGDGAGGFGPPASLGVTYNHLTVLDVDGIGSQRRHCRPPGGGGLSWLRGAANGVFSAPVTLPVGSPLLTSSLGTSTGTPMVTLLWRSTRTSALASI